MGRKGFFQVVGEDFRNFLVLRKLILGVDFSFFSLFCRKLGSEVLGEDQKSFSKDRFQFGEAKLVHNRRGSGVRKLGDIELEGTRNVFLRRDGDNVSCGRTGCRSGAH